jgi:hypothetical protein
MGAILVKLVLIGGGPIVGQFAKTGIHTADKAYYVDTARVTLCSLVYDSYKITRLQRQSDPGAAYDRRFQRPAARPGRREYGRTRVAKRRCLVRSARNDKLVLLCYKILVLNHLPSLTGS